MKPAVKYLIIPVFVSVTAFLTWSSIAADHNVYWFEAPNDDVYLRVFDLDRAGNILDENSLYLNDAIWKGYLEEGEKIIIESSYGSVRYDHRSASDYRTNVNFFRTTISACGNNSGCQSGHAFKAHSKK
jgi:hypothetical protein